MLVRFTKNPADAAADTLTCVRPDGTATGADMPRQGILPHHAFHFVVETALGWHDAFFGCIARGESLVETAARFHAESGAWARHTQAFQTEALIECLQAEQWGGGSDPAAFAEKLIATCRRRGVPPPDITAEELESLRGALREFGAAWRPVPPGASLERTFGT
ncbi:MAG TPA: hypothetical protein VHD62_12035 [Opitutaceae bacterium]|nr:hypothetical protein [Opitutaceae bacterium]